MTKPREWWITKRDSDDGFYFVDVIEGPITNHIKVIEYSALQALAQAAKDFMSALTTEEKIAATGKLSTLITEVDL